MDVQYQLQRELLVKMSNLVQKFTALPEGKRDKFSLKNFIARLEKYSDTFQEQHAKILKSKNMKLTDEYFVKDIAGQAEDAYYDAKSGFDRFLSELGEDPHDSQNQSTILNSTHPALIQSNLPPISIEPFSGKQADWEDFRDLFKSVVHNNEHMGAVNKFYYLRSLVKGKALEIVKSYSLSATHYATAWEALTLHYENRRRLVNKHLHDMFSVRSVKNATSNNLSKLMRDVVDPIDSLHNIGRSTDDLVSDIAVYLISSNLDENTQMDWQKTLGDSVEPPTLQDLRKFLNERIASLESWELRVKPASSSVTSNLNRNVKPAREVSQANHFNERGSSNFSCIFCQQNHSISSCPDFKALQVSDRKSFILKKRRCMNCFNKHFIKECKSQNTCYYCHRQHHTLLHIFRSPKESQCSNGTQQSSVEHVEQKCKSPRSQRKSPVPQCEQKSQHSVEPTSRPTPKFEQESSSGGKGFEKWLPNRSAEESSLNCKETKHSYSASQTGGVLLATALVRVQGNNGIEVVTRALIDSCSQASFMSESLCQRLQLKPKNVHIPITGTGGNVVATVRKSAKVLIKPHFSSSFSTYVDTLVLPKVSSYTPPAMITSLSLPYLENLVLADPRYMDRFHIDMLLGASVYAQIMEGSIVKGQLDEPIATKSTLGWLLTGAIPSHSPHPTSQLTSLHVCDNCDLDQTLQKFWLQEEIPLKPLYTKEEKEFEDHFNQTVSRDEQGRYVLRLPFKEADSRENIDYRPSYYSSEKMLVKMENRFQTDPKLKQMYHDFMKEYQDLEHMTRLPIDHKPSVNRFFIPHHGIWKEKSTSTKLRTVFNASSKLKPGVSLNDLLLVGPNLLPILVDLLISWQKYKYVFVADIEKMYRQMLIHPNDRQFQCILWRSTPTDPIDVYELNTVTYGVASSPCQANMTIKRLAKDHMIDHPWGASVLQDEIYMDDVLSGGHSIVEARTKQQDCTQILKKGCYPLRKYLSNDPEVLHGVPREFLALNSKSFKEIGTEISVLGMSWNPIEDVFTFNIIQFDKVPKLTKRIVLSRTAKLFDPLGWLAPIVIKAKIFMQLLWQEKRGWDDEISSELHKIWTKWEFELSYINQIKIPRWNNYSPDAGIIELHGFADASKLAYGASLYLRVVSRNQVTVSLVIAKSKVAPLKPLSIPRLELSAARLLAKLAKHYLQTTKFAVSSSHLWSDSTDVLQWLKGHPSRWRPFVANRCVSILDDMPDAQWHHVKSKDNPADVISRGCTASELLNNQLWWKGPTWLTGTEGPWSSKPDEVLDTKETPPEENSSKPVALVTVRPRYEFDVIHRFSSIMKLLRVTALCLRFIIRLLNHTLKKRQIQRKAFIESFKKYITSSTYQLNIKEILNQTESRIESHQTLKILGVSFIDSKLDSVSRLISPSELTRSLSFIIYLHQNLHFSGIRKCLQRRTRLPNSSPVLKLNPFMDGNLIRVGGRLANSQLPHDNKHPLLLHPNDDLSYLLIKRAHEDTYHGGVQLTLGTLRLQFWILNGRQAVKSFIRRCHRCIIFSKRGCMQLMGNLPADRTKLSKPFDIAGVDYAGPIKVRLAKVRGNVTQKGYIAIFVCFATHAVHIEIVEDYTSLAFIAAFHRFTSRRGQCSHLHSDQGTNFVGADSELRQMFQGTLEWSDKVKAKLSVSGTCWHFNPPGAPHFGGLWESAVKSMKYHMHRMIGDQTLTFVEYSTLFCRIEAILNSRPLLPLSDDISDVEPLTPAHFLIQRPSYLIPEPDYRHEKVSLSKRWELLTQTVQHFWDRWSVEYLTSLQVRSKWTQKEPSLREGDLVRIKDEVTFPGNWPLGIVTAVHPGKDNLVRAATVRTACSELKRPIVKLVLLERGC